MSIARDRANRVGSDPLVIGASKISSNASDDLVVQDTSNNAKRLITSEVQIGDDDNDKIIIKRDSSTGKVNLQTVSGGGSPADQPTGGLTIYANTSNLPASADEGVMALVTANNFMYVYRSGWYKVAEITNATPTISSAGNASYSFATDGTPVSIEVTASDPEGVPLQYKYTVTSGSLTNGGGATAAVTSSATSGGTYSALAENTLTSNKYFKITPSTNTSYAGAFSLTFHASDGVNVANSSASAFDLSFAPYGSTLFDGTDDYLKVANNTSLRLGTGDFTIECWVKFTTTSLEGGSNRRIFSLMQSAGNAVDKLQICIDNGNYRTNGDLFLYSNSDQGYLGEDIRSAWHHIAVVRNSGTLKFYLDGVSKYSASNTQDYSPGGASGPRPVIGSRGDDKGDYNGYISNFRMVVGTAVYTSNFTVPTAPLTDITNTQLLTCQNYTGTITDESSNAHVISETGGVNATYSSPFVESTAPLSAISNTQLLTCQNSTGAITDASSNGYTITTNGDAQASGLHPFNANGSTDGSYYFSSLNAWNGTNARVITADSNDFNLPDGTDVTVEFWYKIPVTPPTAGNGYLFDLGDGNYGWLAAYAWNQNGTHTLRVGTYFGAIWLADEDLVGMVQNLSLIHISEPTRLLSMWVWGVWG